MKNIAVFLLYGEEKAIENYIGKLVFLDRKHAHEGFHAYQSINYAINNYTRPDPINQILIEQPDGVILRDD